MTQPLEKVFGEVLKELRNKVGISQENLAYESDLDRSFISLLERGLRMPTIATIFRIAKPLNISPSEIIEIIQKRYENS